MARKKTRSNKNNKTRSTNTTTANLRRSTVRSKRINLLERTIDTRRGGSRPQWNYIPTSPPLFGGLGGFLKSPHQKNNARLRAQFKSRTPPEQDLAKRKKTPIENWSDRNLRLRCKDRPKKNTPTGGSGSKKSFVPWC